MPAVNCVVVRGSGIAALTCVFLLSRKGWDVRHVPSVSARPPQLMIGAQTAALLADLWNDADVLADTHPIAARAVSWGEGDVLQEIPSASVVVAAEALSRRLKARLPMDAATPPRWIVDAVGSPGEAQHRFGSRHAWTATVKLRPLARQDVCMMETASCGWLFLLPLGGEHACLQFIAPGNLPDVPTPADAVRASQHITKLIVSPDPWAGPFPAMPRIRLPLTRFEEGDGTVLISIGEAAAGFDPIGGDGVGHALKSAVLAVQMLQMIADGASISACLGQYSNMLCRAMHHHLTTCIGYYRNARSVEIWRKDIASMQAGLHLC